MEYFRKLRLRAELAKLGSLNKRMMKITAFIVLTLFVHLARPAFGGSEVQPIDCAHSTITVYVYKTGILSTLAHNHEIEAPIDSGDVKSSESPSVDLRIDASKLRVVDAEVSAETQAKIQATMQGDEVLDVGRFPEIHFQSTGVEPSGTGHSQLRRVPHTQRKPSDGSAKHRPSYQPHESQRRHQLVHPLSQRDKP